MKPRKLLERLQNGAYQNVAFDDFVALIEVFGFYETRSRGSHRLFAHPICEEELNLQPKHGEAKPYQIRQFLNLVEGYNLSMREDQQ